MGSRRDRGRGALLGLACGDALGRPVEFHSPERIRRKHGRVTEMIGDGIHGQPAGTVTDDTDLALCIGRSLVERGQFDGADIAERFVDWREADPFDIGAMTADAIDAYRRGASWREAGEQVWRRRSEGENAGNGSVMRCAPHALALDGADPSELAEVSRRSSSITHSDPRCKEGCAFLNLTIAGHIRGEDGAAETALDRLDDAPDELVTALESVLTGRAPGELRTSGYVVHTLQTALHDARAADSAEEAIVTAVNRGGDTDTVGAVTGALAGASRGASALPDRWLETLDVRRELEQVADELVASDRRATL